MLNSKSEILILAGFLLVITGAILLVLAMDGVSSGFFFIFPFFFFGNPGPFGIVILGVALFMMMMCIWQMSRGVFGPMRIETDSRNARTIECQICGSPLLYNSEYCHRCGSRVSLERE
ncbi:MAG: hypothetical protein ACFFD3_01020 [Candidatus Thorarchaeota archaeon]